MSWRANLADQVGRGAVVYEDFAVEPAGSEIFAIGRIANGLDEPRVLLLRLLELERRALEDSDCVVLASGDDTERPGRTEVDAVDRLRLTANLAHRRSGLGHEDVTESLASLADHDNSLVVSRPRDILDRSTDRLELVLQQVLFVHGVPDSNLARGIAAGDVEATRRIFGNVDSAGMLGVDISYGWILKIETKS